MPVSLVSTPAPDSRPIYAVRKGGLAEIGLDSPSAAWAKACGFDGETGRVLVLPSPDGSVAGALFGTGDRFVDAMGYGVLARALPEGDWHFADAATSWLAALAVQLGGYAFTRYGRKPGQTVRLACSQPEQLNRIARTASAVFLVRDLINTPTNDMSPADLEAATRRLAAEHRARTKVIEGDALLERGFPMIHAVGRASAVPPRLIDLTWGRTGAPKVTLVGKGVCFDTGGLDIKPASNMLLMKKDMGGAANVLGLASIIMAEGLDVRLRVLIPAVENAIGGNAFRPGDVLVGRNGLTVEIGNTDAEGRLILADALTLADEEAPDLLVDIATLTGAARVALGPDLPPFYTDDDDLAQALAVEAAAQQDPLWRMPLWKPYEAKLASKIADLNNVTTDSFAGSITAALFLRRFVERARSWVHFDIFGWSPSDRPQGPAGGEAQGIRALAQVIRDRYASPVVPNAPPRRQRR